MRNKILSIFTLLTLTTCAASFAQEESKPVATEATTTAQNLVARKNMVEQYVVGYGMFDKKIIQAFLKVPRHEFAMEEAKNDAYSDKPVLFTKTMSMSRPYETALMTKLLSLKGEEKVLELGTGSGYHSAILSLLCKDVYTVDIQKDIKEAAEKKLTSLGYDNIHCRLGEGTLGWPEEAPFDAIIVGFAADSIIPELIKQLKDGGRLVIPVETAAGEQQLKLVIKKGDETEVKDIIPVKFISMIKQQAEVKTETKTK